MLGPIEWYEFPLFHDRRRLPLDFGLLLSSERGVLSETVIITYSALCLHEVGYELVPYEDLRDSRSAALTSD